MAESTTQPTAQSEAQIALLIEQTMGLLHPANRRALATMLKTLIAAETKGVASDITRDLLDKFAKIERALHGQDKDATRRVVGNAVNRWGKRSK